MTTNLDALVNLSEAEIDEQAEELGERFGLTRSEVLFIWRSERKKREEEGGDDEVDQRRTQPLSEVEARPVRWLWEGRIPFGALTLFGGDPGGGKTTVALFVAAQHSTGLPMPMSATTERTTPGVVLIITAEDSPEHTLRPRLEAAGADLARVHIWRAAEMPTLPSGVGVLDDEMRRLGVSLLIFDPISAFLDDDQNSHADADVRRSLRPLLGACEARGIAVLGVRHLNKQVSNASAIHRGSGTMAWTATARSEFLFAAHPENSELHVMAHSKFNLSPRATSLAYMLNPVEVEGIREVVTVNWVGEVNLQANELLMQQAAARKPGRSRSHGQIVGLLRERLASGPKPASETKEWLRDAGFGKSAVENATQALTEEGLLVRRPNGKGGAWTWRWVEPEGPDWEDDADPGNPPPAPAARDFLPEPPTQKTRKNRKSRKTSNSSYSSESSESPAGTSGQEDLADGPLPLPETDDVL